MVIQFGGFIVAYFIYYLYHNYCDSCFNSECRPRADAASNGLHCSLLATYSAV